ncbi:hypothetical protein VTK73DRAFT_5198 [Phialemonium thermophilum]|uniref:Uncharacterized protein n=1 Tax=Phialemonium thermophilum TaxID=223376 RepID=A0ABR3V2X2_9PEZI
MAARRFADYAASQDEPIFKLPHPYLTAYHVVASDDNDNNENDDGEQQPQQQQQQSCLLHRAPGPQVERPP